MSKLKFFLILASALLISCANPTDPEGNGTGDGGKGDGTTIVDGKKYKEWYLSDEEQKKQFSLGPTALFSTIASDQYRIPAIVVATNGNIIAFGDSRYGINGDVGNDNLIDIVFRVSSDGGYNWTSKQIVGNKSTSKTDNKGDALVFSAKNGDIVVLAAGGGAWSTAPSDPAKIWMSRSTDYGYTWSNWKEVGQEIWDALTGLGFQRKAFAASGRGLTMRDGRLIAAMLIMDTTGKQGTLTIYSDDNGNTWKAGGSIKGDLNGVYPNEPKVIAELDNGTLLMSTRPNGQQNNGYRMFSTSTDKGLNWTKYEYRELKDGDANGEGVVWTSKYRNAPHNYILHVNCSEGIRRKKITLNISKDNGSSWQKLLTYYDGDSCYASIDVLQDGTVILLTEEPKASPGEGSDQNGWYDLVFRRYNMNYLTGGAESYSTDWYLEVNE